jgi:hypothetical protein
MKSVRFLCVLAILALVISGCKSSSSDSDSDGEDGIYSNKILPANLVIKLPASLGAAADESLSIHASRSSSSGISFASVYSSFSAGYFQVQCAVSMMKDMGPQLVLFGIIVDAVISQNNLGAGSYASEKVTLTQGMYDAIAAQLPASERPDKSYIGSSITLTNIVYSKSGSGDFQNSFTFSISEGGEAFSPKYEWSSDRTKLRMSVTSSGDYAFAITYDTSTNSCAFQIVGGGSTYELAVQSDSANAAKNGVCVYESCTGSYSGSDYTYAIYGYADDDGGLVLTNYTNTPGGSIYYKEGFGPTGGLLYAAYGATAASLTVDTTYADETPVTVYGAKADGAGSASTYGALTLLL